LSRTPGRYCSEATGYSSIGQPRIDQAGGSAVPDLETDIAATKEAVGVIVRSVVF
jgi:hypothetical protein